MKNKFINTDIDLYIVDRNGSQITLYISKKLLINFNKKSDNLNLNYNGMQDYDFFELYVNAGMLTVDIYKPHVIGKINGDINKYLDIQIIKQIDKLGNLSKNLGMVRRITNK